MQKFIVKLVSVAAIAGLSSTIALAQGHTVKVTLDCPDIEAKGSENVTNYGTYIAGKGIEKVNSDASTFPLFQGPTVPGANIPTDLVSNGYFNNGVSYNPANGAVTCYFQSSMGFDPFSISYLMTNAMNGTTASSGSEEIHIKLPIGLTA